jgi:DNA polymerase-3 subunit delta
MPTTQHAFDFLDSPLAEIPPVVVLFGSEAFLKRLVRDKLRGIILGTDHEAPFATFEGDSVEWCDVSDEIATVSLFGSQFRRLVFVQNADKFVSGFRSQLEDYLEHPRRRGVLVLEVGTWASNTRLYKSVDKSGLQIDCRLPQKTVGRRTELDEARVCKWLIAQCNERHQAQLETTAAKLLIELGEIELGRLDQELAKLALFAGTTGKITAEIVRDVIGGWRVKTVWEMIDAAADGNAAEALQQLDHALSSGEHPQALFGQISWSLRRFAVATRYYQMAERRGQRISLRDALQQGGFRPWPADALTNAERQLKQMGRDRAGQMLKWLLEADLAMKGSHSAPERARFVLERLFLRMAKQAPGPRLQAPRSGN